MPKSSSEPIPPPDPAAFVSIGQVTSAATGGGSTVGQTVGAPKSERETGEDSEIDESLAKQLAAALDLSTWTSGERLGELSARLEREVEFAARYETEMGPKVLALLRDRLPTAPDRSRESGVYKLTADDVAAA